MESRDYTPEAVSKQHFPKRELSPKEYGLKLLNRRK